MRIEIVTTGDEILQGIIVDTNSTWIAERCQMLGHEIVRFTSVGDDAGTIGEALKSAASRAECVIVSGGLGPTADDITVEAAAKVFGTPLYLDESVLEDIKSFFARMDRPMAKTNEKQAMIPEGGRPLPNVVGTAPGIQAKMGGAEFFFLPGVPRELYKMFEDHVMPWLKSQVKGHCESIIIRCFGMPEATIDEKLTGIQLFGSRLSFRVKFPEILLKLVARSDNASKAKESMLSAAKEIKARLGNVVYGEGETGMAEVVGKMLRDKNMTLSVAESCTGGLLASIITDVPGCSDYFERGVVTYSNRSKLELLGISADTLRANGAVSKETAMAMAEGVRRISGASIGVGITGIAGPGGGTPEKPVGTVHMAYSVEGKTEALEHRFTGDRERIKQMSAMAALNMVRKYLLSVEV